MCCITSTLNSEQTVAILAKLISRPRCVAQAPASVPVASGAGGAGDLMISPLTGELIPASKLQEHLRISLLDPRWREQRDKERREKMEQEAVFAHGQFVEHNLKQLAERRTDIFGVGQEETAIGRKVSLS